MSRVDKQTVSLGVLCAVLMTGCPEPPPGLLDALQRSMMGDLMCDVAGLCTGTGEINIGVSDTEAGLQQKFGNLSRGWCPVWTMEADRIAQNDQARLKKSARYHVNLAVFGQVTLATGDFEGTVSASQAGWRTTIKHTGHGEGGVAGRCPENVPYMQCKFQPSVSWTANEELTLSWTDARGSHTASASAGEVLTYAPGTPIEWCDKRPHGAPLECSAGVPDSGTRACSDHADCAGLPCGEWICSEETRQCVNAEQAPDGTSCGEGTCRGGQCIMGR